MVNDDNSTSVTEVGLPITYTHYGKDIESIESRSFSILNTLTEETVPRKVIEPSTKYQLKNSVTIIPLSSYNYGTTYEVTMSFRLNFEDGTSKSINETVSFSTSGFMAKLVESKYVTRAYLTEKVMTNSRFGFTLVDPLELAFKDVDIQSNNSIYIHTASELGIINGIGNDLFGPNLNIQKEQAYKIFIEAYERAIEDNVEVADVILPYVDYVDVSDWAKNYVRKAKKLDILLIEDNLINPKDYVTEDEFNSMMERLNSVLEEMSN